MRAITLRELLSKRYDTLSWSQRWADAFGHPETSGVWFIWGQSGNGKSSFVMQLASELTHHGKVLVNELEEGTRKSLQDTARRALADCVADNIQFVQESMTEMEARLSRRRAAQFVIVNSYQYTELSYKAYRALKARHPDKLMVFVSHARGKQPDGRSAMAVKFDADLKIYCEGFRAISNGRTNPGGVFDIWPERSAQYWGEKQKVSDK